MRKAKDTDDLLTCKLTLRYHTAKGQNSKKIGTEQSTKTAIEQFEPGVRIPACMCTV